MKPHGPIAAATVVVAVGTLLLVAGCSGGRNPSAGSNAASSAGASAVTTTTDGYKQYQIRGFTLKWKFHQGLMEVVVSYATTGWVGVGFGNTGTMKGSNIVIGYVKDGKVVMQDDFGDSTNHHAPDTTLGGSDQLTNESGTEAGGVTELHFTMPLETGDKSDFALKPGGTYKVIMAHGPNGADDFTTYHGHGSRVSFEVTL